MFIIIMGNIIKNTEKLSKFENDFEEIEGWSNEKDGE